MIVIVADAVDGDADRETVYFTVVSEPLEPITEAATRAAELPLKPERR